MQLHSHKKEYFNIADIKMLGQLHLIYTAATM
jgi:hypothetical protein